MQQHNGTRGKSELTHNLAICDVAQVAPRLQVNVFAEKANTTISQQSLDTASVDAASSLIYAVRIYSTIILFGVRAYKRREKGCLREERIKPRVTGLATGVCVLVSSVAEASIPGSLTDSR